MEYDNLKQALLNVVGLQNKMNTIFNHKPELGNWLLNNNDWILATSIETAEFVNWITYKWWKKPNPNMKEAFIELVDILHFQASYILQVSSESINGSIDETKKDFIISGITEQILKDYNEGYKQTENRDDINNVAKKLLYGSSDVISNFSVLFKLVYAIGYTAEDLFKTYTVKNVLNEFRQLRGDRNGTYIKIWEKRNGVDIEDNAIVFELVEKKPELIYDLNKLMYEINYIYTQIPLTE